MGADTGASQSSRVLYLDGLRGLAAGYVLLHHIWLTLPASSEPRSAGARVVGALLDEGHWAVAVFLVLSGFSLTLRTAGRHVRLTESPWSFMRRRARRIFPTYWAALAVSVLFAATRAGAEDTGLWGYSVPYDWRDVLVHAFMLQDFWHPSAVNYVMWTVAIEWHFYLLFPLLLALFRSRRGIVVAAGLCVLAVAATALVNEAQHFLYASTFLGACFLCGIGGAWCSRNGGPRFPTGRAVSLPWSSIALLAALLAVVEVMAGAPYYVSDVTVGAATAAALISMGEGRSRWLRGFLSAPTLVWLGLVSYSLYLIHPVVVQAVWSLTRTSGLSGSASTSVFVTVSALASVCAARLLFAGVERPFLGKVRSLP